MTVAHAGKGWRLAPSLVALEAEFDAAWPRRSRASDGSIGDAAHRRRRSDHNPSSGFVHGIDITDDPRNGPDVSVVARQIAARRDPRLEYVISDAEIWERQTGRWRRYTGANPHRHHAHFSIRHTAQARNDLSPWLTPVRAPSTSAAPTVAPAVPTPPVVASPRPPLLFAPEEDDEMRIIQHAPTGAARLSNGGMLFDLIAEGYNYYRNELGVRVVVCDQLRWDIEHACHADGNALNRELKR